MHALTAHFKSKLLTFPGRRPDQPRFDTNDEGERARFGLYALTQRAAEAASARAWATTQLQNAGQTLHVLICGDLNDTPHAATTQLLLGPPGSQLGTGGFNHADRGDGNRLWNLAPAMPTGDPHTGVPAANWSRINNGVPELIDQLLVSHSLVQALDSTESLPLEGIGSVTADPESTRVRWRLGYPAFSGVRGLMYRPLCRSRSAWWLPSAGVWSGPASSPA